MRTLSSPWDLSFGPGNSLIGSLQKIFLLKSHVNSEGQGRLTEMTLDRITLMAI